MSKYITPFQLPGASHFYSVEIPTKQNPKEKMMRNYWSNPGYTLLLTIVKQFRSY